MCPFNKNSKLFATVIIIIIKYRCNYTNTVSTKVGVLKDTN